HLAGWRLFFFLVIIFLLMPVTCTRRGAPTETYKPLNQRLRRLDQQFKRFQQMTFTHLQSIAENYNISDNIDSRFQVLSRQFERISRELCAFKETTDHSLNSLKSWTKSLQKKTKRLDSSLANMTRALRETTISTLDKSKSRERGCPTCPTRSRNCKVTLALWNPLRIRFNMECGTFRPLSKDIQNKRQTTAALAEHRTTNSSGRQNIFFFTLCQNVKCLIILSLILKVCNVGSMLLFPSASAENYVTFQSSFRTGIHELSICTWLKVDPAYRELSLQNILDGHWHHLCIIWSSIEGRFWYYLDRHLISTGSKFQKGYEIPPGGSMVLGQEQDSIGGDFDEAEAFVGKLAGFVLWTRSLSPGEVSGLASGKGVPRGAVLSLDDVDQMFVSVQHITCECLEHCM
uniref:Pentraxin 4, long n=1 Tax=Sinocyclocheilus rhinocerous TaxID=307959 RepID=A0A673J064_9TELE